MKNIYFLLLIILSFKSNGQDVKISNTPSWVNLVDLKSDSILSKGVGYQYLMIDFQENIPLQSIYRHNMVSVFNSEGIQEQSDITVSYDPSYQVLKFHKLQIIRDGKTIDKTKTIPIKSIQQETGQSRGLYDDRLSALIHFDDVQKGDIIEYAYTIKGYNPIYKGEFSTQLLLQYSVPINQFYYRILSKDKLTYNLLDSASNPQINSIGNGFEYIWDTDGFNPVIYDVQVPYWYNKQKRVDISTYNNWREVSKLLYPLYQYNKHDISVITKTILDQSSIKDTVLSLINYVQDDIRYLGLEAGINAFKPHDPELVFTQKYGDCKDKSLLLVALLRDVGIDASPVLVNSWKAESIKYGLPSINAFNHCVVNFKKNNKTYYVDPTISNQGGDIDHISFPDYKYGLIIAKNTSDLIQFPKPRKSMMKVEEEFVINNYKDASYLEIISVYSGYKADEMRSLFEGNNFSNIEKNFLDYYSQLFPNISTDKPLEIIDTSVNHDNLYITIENYKIDSIWVKNTENPDLIKIEIFPLNIYNTISYSNSANRTQPFDLGGENHYSQLTRFTMPENWPSKPIEKIVSGPGYKYSMLSESNGKVVTLNYSYDNDVDWLPAEDVKTFLQKKDEIIDNLTYEIIYLQDDPNAKNHIGLILFTLFILAIGIYYGRKIYLNYNPKTNNNISSLKIGGWLFLPLIGLLLTPVYLWIELINVDYLNAQTWMNLSLITDHSISAYILMTIEMIYHIGLILFSILLVILYLQKRTSVPRLMIMFYIISTVFPFLDSILAEVLLGSDSLELMAMEIGSEIFRGIIIVVIWIPYFIKSERVKNTFCKVLYHGKLIHIGDLNSNENKETDVY